MTTKDFIAKTFGTTNERWGRHGYDRWCSSVVTDKDGTVYSYGRHYPLLFEVAGRNFVNTRGYSNTTAKHINWAWAAVDYNAIGVELNREQSEVIAASYSSTTDKLKAIKQALLEQHNRLFEELSSKKRKDTWIYSHLQAELARVTESINQIGARVS